MKPPKSGKPLTAEERQALETERTFRRVFGLCLDPVQGNFDAAHMKEINRRIFQDLPRLGFDDVTPGEHRPAVEAGNDWMKTRWLEAVAVPSHVSHVPPPKAALATEPVAESARYHQMRETARRGLG